MGSWKNNDGLYLKYGPDKATPNIAGEYKRVGGQTAQVEYKVDLTALTQTETILSDVQVIPAGARIQEVEVVTRTAAATGTAIDVGLIKTDRTTEIDYDGLLAAFPTSQMNAGGERTILTNSSTVPATQTGTGALIGTTTSFVGHVSASRTDATAFTAGLVYITIRYYMP